jgi:hypothetical protein
MKKTSRRFLRVVDFLFSDPPMWVRKQNSSGHGVEFAFYTGVEMKKARNVAEHKAGL